MKAIVINEHGDLNKVTFDEVPVPEIGPDDALVEIRAVSHGGIATSNQDGKAEYQEKSHASKIRLRSVTVTNQPGRYSRKLPSE